MTEHLLLFSRGLHHVMRRDGVEVWSGELVCMHHVVVDREEFWKVRLLRFVCGGHELARVRFDISVVGHTGGDAGRVNERCVGAC